MLKEEEKQMFKQIIRNMPARFTRWLLPTILIHLLNGIQIDDVLQIVKNSDARMIGICYRSSLTKPWAFVDLNGKRFFGGTQ